MNLLNNAILLFIGILFKGGSLLLIDRIIATNIGPSHFGLFKYYITVLIILSSISSLGFNSSIIRFLSINITDKNYISSLIRFTSRKIIIVSLIIIFIGQFSLTLDILNINYYSNFKIIIISILGLSINTYIIGIYNNK